MQVLKLNGENLLMRYKLTTYIILVILCTLTAGTALAQDTAKTDRLSNIDSTMAISPDYLRTRYAPFPTIDFQPLVYQEIDTSLIHISEYDPLLKVQNLYQSLGINGQAHRSMVFGIEHDLGFTMITLPYPLYFKKMSDLKLYNLETSFTDIDFTYGILNELTFKATHAQRIRQVNFSVDIDGASNKGYFIHQEINRLNLSAVVRYETPKKIYGFLAAYNLNHGKFSENGGLENCPDFTDRDPRDSTITYDLSSFAVMFSNAQTLINQHNTQLTNYVNIRSKKGNYYGTISHTLDIDFLKSSFTDHDLNNLFYLNRYYINTDTTNDSIQYFRIANTLQWSNYSPIDTIGDQPYFIRFAGGLRQEYVNARCPYYIGNSLALFARTYIRLFKVWDIYGNISYSMFGYNHNDAMTTAGFRFNINPKQRHLLGLEASFLRYSPDYIYTNYYGNNNAWRTNWKKQNVFKAGAYWTIFDYSLRFNFINAGKYVFLNSSFEPMQLEKPFQIVELLLYAPVRLKHFSFDANVALQHSTNRAITVPLFAGKFSAIYATSIFKKRLHFQVGIDLFYNTKYYADGYNAILHQFYAQEYISTGNYLYLNAHLALRVKRTSFYVRGGNLIAGLLSFRYITTPGYPMQGRNFEVGVNWKFYD